MNDAAADSAVALYMDRLATALSRMPERLTRAGPGMVWTAPAARPVEKDPAWDWRLIEECMRALSAVADTELRSD